jgi:NAD(P)-dependent dehydrogenase (short-subunit alcohol dehydrogenase family)
VTGAASGIGRATAIAFAFEGASVVVADISEQWSQETANIIKGASWTSKDGKDHRLKFLETQHQIRYKEDPQKYYYQLRKIDPTKLSDTIARAARFIALNRTPMILFPPICFTAASSSL